MAAYAAFKHVELYNVGKAKKRVLRPPGGGSSDIFGADMPQTPRTVKNRMASNIFSAEKDAAVKNTGDAPRRAQKNVDSYSRLFGEPARPVTPAKNHMKSSIPFGQNNEAAAQQLLTNGNGHYNGKSGSVSSASSSVSSSTENLKMNGGSRSVNLESPRRMSRNERDPACPLTPIPSSDPAPPADVLQRDLPCNDIEVGDVPEDNNMYVEPGHRTMGIQTRRDIGTNPPRPYSLDNRNFAPDLKEPLGPCAANTAESSMPCEPIDRDTLRNPITGSGLNGDGEGGFNKNKRQRTREGNPVTGEGYKPADYQVGGGSTAHVINKNRIPPGGYSSGLW